MDVDDQARAVRKLTKRLGREPLREEVSAYVARKRARQEDRERTTSKAQRRLQKRLGRDPTSEEVDEYLDHKSKKKMKQMESNHQVEQEQEEQAQDVFQGSILLFYGYISPPWTSQHQNECIEFAKRVLTQNKCTGRLRVAREGLNATLTGPTEGIRAFARELAERYPEKFEKQFKFVDGQPERVMEKELKVFPVQELVTYGFAPHRGKIKRTGNHLPPALYHQAMSDPNAVMIDVRNFNESVIGKFAPPGVEVLDPKMRRSTEFPKWVDDNLDKLKDKKVLMYCTGGIRCERASAYLVEKGLEDVNQLDGGIHRYLEEYVEDGGHWIGSNYTFDKRFAHGADNAEVISTCVVCESPWQRYQARKKCSMCKMEVLVCRQCQRLDSLKGDERKPIDPTKLVCPLCKDPASRKIHKYGRHG